MIMFKEEAGEYPEKALQTVVKDGQTLFKKFVDWTPAEYDADGELSEYGELRFRKLICVEIFSEKYSKMHQNGVYRTECVYWDFQSEQPEYRPNAADFLSMEATDYDFWENCRVNAYVAVPDLMTTANRMQDEFSDVLDFLDGGNFDQDWDQIKDQHEFEKVFADGLRASGIKVDMSDAGRGVLEFLTKRGVKARFIFE